LHVLNDSHIGRSIAADIAAKSRPDSVKVEAAHQFLRSYLQDGAAAEVALQDAIGHYRDWFASSPLASLRWRARQLLGREPTAPSQAAVFDLECSTLNAVANLLAAAKVRFEGRDAHASGDVQAPALTQVILGALHTSFNPAYVYPELSHYHETFAVAGWLGWLQRGRRAILPVFLAEHLLDILNRVSSPPDAVLNYYVEEIVGTKYLGKAARGVLARGTGSIIKPRPAPHRSDPRHILAILHSRERRYLREPSSTAFWRRMAGTYLQAQHRLDLDRGSSPLLSMTLSEAPHKPSLPSFAAILRPCWCFDALRTSIGILCVERAPWPEPPDHQSGLTARLAS
jgi:hypothetical protein